MKIKSFLTFSIAILFSITAFCQIDNNFYQLADEAYNKEDYVKSAELFVKAYENPVNDRIKMFAAYNAACAFSLSNNKKQALKFAKIALESGLLLFEGDKDFDNIKNTGKFKKILKTAAQKIAELQSTSNTLPITYTPKGYNKNEALPLIVILHGYGGNPKGIIEVYKPLAEARNAILLSCRASEIETENSFYWDYDNKEALTFLRRQIESAIKKFSIDKGKVILTGFSQGGYLTYDFGLKNADLFTGFIPVAGRVPEAIKLHSYANKNLKIWSIAGLKESENFLTTYEGLEDKLDKMNIHYQLKFHNIGHEYPANSEEELLKAFDWLIE